jgi:tripartite ATP-independent transporter DctM subunit
MADIAQPAMAAASATGIGRAEKWCARWTQPLAFIGVIGMLIAAGATVLDVLLRWLFNSPLPALNEVIAMTFCVAVSATIPSGIATNVNLKVDILARWTTGRLAAWLDAFGGVMLLIFFSLLTWQIEVYAGQLAEQGRGTVMLGLPQAPFVYGAALLIGIGCLVQVVMAAGAIERAFTHVSKYSAQKSPIAMTVFMVTMILVVLALAVYIAFNFPSVSLWAQRHVGTEVFWGFILMWALMLLLVPIAALMGLTGLCGAALLIGFPPALSAFATEAEGFLTNSQIATLPLFLMMGSFASVSDMATDLYDLAHVVLGRFRGGLALATIGGCAGFGALTSSSIATAALIGKVAIPEMRNRGYSPALSTGCCAAGGCLGPLVPPGSGPLVVFALLTEASVGRLFIGSVGPAILAVLLYFLTVIIYVRVAPKSAPAREPDSAKKSVGDMVRMLWRCKAVIFVFFLVMGGLYAGVFTDTESAAVGAFTTFGIAVWRGKLGGGRFWEVMAETTATTALVYGLIFGAQTFSFFVAVSALAQNVTAWFGSLGWDPVWIMALRLVGFLALGSLMESFAVMVITVPIITPLVLSMGYDIIWWGVIQLCVVETGLIHPPFGLNVFVLKNMTPDIGIWTIYKGVFPFVISDLVKLVLMVMFPGITLWLVNSMMTQ